MLLSSVLILSLGLRWSMRRKRRLKGRWWELNVSSCWTCSSRPSRSTSITTLRRWWTSPNNLWWAACTHTNPCETGNMYTHSNMHTCNSITVKSIKKKTIHLPTIHLALLNLNKSPTVWRSCLFTLSVVAEIWANVCTHTHAHMAWIDTVQWIRSSSQWTEMCRCWWDL